MQMHVWEGEEKQRGEAVDHAATLLEEFSTGRLRDVVDLAAMICGVPVAFLSLVGSERQTFPASRNLDITETPSSESICQYTIAGHEPMVVEDTRLDLRFSALPCVTGGPKIVFYAGVRVCDPDSVPLGALCVVDSEPRRLEDHQIESLVKLGRIAETKVALTLARDDARKQAEELRQRNAMFDIVGRHTPELFWVYDKANSRLDYINAAVEDIYGVDRTKLMTNPRIWVDSVLERSQRKELINQMQSHPERMDVRYQVPNRHGEIRWLHTRGFPIPDTTRVVGITLDVTEQVEREQAQQSALRVAEDAVHALEESRRRVFQAARDPRVVCTSDGMITSANRAVEGLFGVTVDSLVGRSIWDFVNDSSAEKLRRQTEELEADEVFEDIEFRASDGRVFAADISRSKIEMEGTPLFHLAIYDRSELEEAREKLRIANERLATSQKFEALGQLAGGIAHDFNNMLSIIKTYAQFALAEIDEDNPVREDIGEILAATVRSTELTEKLLAFGRRKSQLEEPVVVDVLLDELCSVFKRTLESGVTLERNLGAGECELRVAPGDLQQIVMNLVLNADAAMKETGGALRIASRVTDEFVELMVKDDGPGMSEAVKSRIFEPFYTTKEGCGGTGLGLTTVKSLIQQLGGEITVDSRLGLGTTFRVRLPLDTAIEESTFVEEEPRLPAPASLRTILVAEDEATLRSAMIRVLSERGFEVVGASDGIEALQLAREHVPDLVVTDVQMPRLGGLELVETLRSDGYTGHVLFVSDMLRGQTLDEVLPKPFTADELVVLIDQMARGANDER